MCIHIVKIVYLSYCIQPNVIIRSSQIACTVSTVHVMYMQATLCVHKNLCTVLIPLCKNNLNLSMVSSFFLPCAYFSRLLVHPVVMLVP